MPQTVPIGPESPNCCEVDNPDLVLCSFPGEKTKVSVPGAPIAPEKCSSKLKDMKLPLPAFRDSVECPVIKQPGQQVPFAPQDRSTHCRFSSARFSEVPDTCLDTERDSFLILR
jgi:hypothetical protein